MRRILPLLARPFRRRGPRFDPWLVFREFEQSLHTIEDLDQLALNLLGKIRELLAAERVVLGLFDGDSGRLRVRHSLPAPAAGESVASLDPGRPLVQWLRVNETHLDLRRNGGVRASLDQEELELLERWGIDLCFPILAVNRLIGVILVGRGASAEERGRTDMIAALMPQIGIALENALLYREQKERFRRMSRADKLATVGELAAGAAHEIRNPLTAVKSSLQYLLPKVSGEVERGLLVDSLDEIRRIEQILSDLLSFARPAELQSGPVDLADTVGRTLELIQFQARQGGVEIVRELPAGGVWLTGDSAQLKQLFLNLFLNAVQAMERGGRLEVRVSAAERAAVVTVRDNGCGIAAEHLERVFDPFFTLKKGGTGLGLSICYGIVQRHGGEIELHSEVGRGTTVAVKFPLKQGR